MNDDTSGAKRIQNMLINGRDLLRGGYPGGDARLIGNDEQRKPRTERTYGIERPGKEAHLINGADEPPIFYEYAVTVEKYCLHTASNSA